ncbi:MAG TPA: hypothetical protein VE685_08970 [Thermoanaerobaculia bacterium]|nr:hypothetical protein [Thermoanaerobaculia bacterium]
MPSISRVLAVAALPVLAVLPARAEVHELVFGETPAHEDFHPLGPTLTALTDGSFAVVWRELQNQESNLRMQWVRPDGSFVFERGGRPVSATSQRELSPAVLAAPDGGAFVAFRRGSRILIQSYDPSGNPRWGADAISVGDSADREAQHEPRLLAAPGGGTYVCFQEYSRSRKAYRVRCQRLSADGRLLWSGTGHEAEGRPGWQVLPQVVEDGEGGLLVFWRNQGLPFGDDRIDRILVEGQRFAPDGTRLWTGGVVAHVTNLPEANGYGTREHFAVPDGRGGAVLAFRDQNVRSRPSYDVVAQRVDARGRALWGDGVHVTGDRRWQFVDGLIAAPDGGAFVAVNVPGGRTRDQLRLFRLGPDGRHRWSPAGISLARSLPTTRVQALFGSFDGGLLRVAWNQKIHGTSSGLDIRLAAFDPAGRRLSDPGSLPLSTAPGDQQLHGFVFDHRSGRGLLIWIDRGFPGGLHDSDAHGALYTEEPRER